MEDYPILMKPLDSLEFSDSFKAMAAAQHFGTLSDILNWPPSILLLHEGFTHHHYQELRNFLIKNNLLHILKTDQ
jgi:hypothetical protein